MSINLIDTKFLNYNIRSCIIEDTEMFLISDLLRQYNFINNKNKQFYDYLKNKQTQELLEFYQKDTVTENYRLPYENENKWDIPKVIHFITIPVFDNGANKGYVVCEELLIACLMWCNPIFATQIYSFIKNLRKINNDRFTEMLNSNQDKEKQINLLQEQVNQYERENKQLKSRYTPEDFNWHFQVCHNESTNIITTVITKDQYKPVDKNIKRVYDLVCCNPLILEQQLIDILINDQRFTQVSNKEFTTSIDSKYIFWFFKNKCKKLRNNLEWLTGIKN